MPAPHVLSVDLERPGAASLLAAELNARDLEPANVGRFPGSSAPPQCQIDRPVSAASRNRVTLRSPFRAAAMILLIMTS
jgi:hypothetical protein